MVSGDSSGSGGAGGDTGSGGIVVQPAATRAPREAAAPVRNVRRGKGGDRSSGTEISLDRRGGSSDGCADAQPPSVLSKKGGSVRSPSPGRSCGVLGIDTPRQGLEIECISDRHDGHSSGHDTWQARAMVLALGHVSGRKGGSVVPSRFAVIAQNVEALRLDTARNARRAEAWHRGNRHVDRKQDRNKRREAPNRRPGNEDDHFPAFRPRCAGKAETRRGNGPLGGRPTRSFRPQEQLDLFDPVGIPAATAAGAMLTHALFTRPAP